MAPPTRIPHPGLAKVRAAPLVQRRNVELILAPAGPIRDLVEVADVVSEGRAQPEDGELVYYGSTSVLLLRRTDGGTVPDGDVAALASLLRADPHLRLRVLRIAHREASARAGAPLGTVRAEIDVSPGARGVAVLVEVVARLARPGLRSTRPADSGVGTATRAEGAGPER